MPAAAPLEAVTVEAFALEDEGAALCHPSWPLLLYAGALADACTPDGCEALFEKHGWGGVWRNGIFPYHHYHSTSHEVLGVVRGRARVAFGGDGGVTQQVEAGDVVILPAGTGHCRLDASSDFLVIGAYPHGQERYDLCTDAPDAEALERIRTVPRPEADPVYGSAGPLLDRWPPR